jgi:hypothetical protein
MENILENCRTVEHLVAHRGNKEARMPLSEMCERLLDGPLLLRHARRENRSAVHEGCVQLREHARRIVVSGVVKAINSTLCKS